MPSRAVQPAAVAMAHPWQVQPRDVAVRRGRAAGIKTAAAAPTAVVYPQATGVMGWAAQPWPDAVSSISLSAAQSQYPMAPVTAMMVRGAHKCGVR